MKSTLVLQASLQEEKKLRVENAKLKKEIEGLKQELIQAEIRNGGGKKILSSYNLVLLSLDHVLCYLWHVLQTLGFPGLHGYDKLLTSNILVSCSKLAAGTLAKS